MKTRKMTRLLGMIMSVFMLFGMLPDTGLSAIAADEDVTADEDMTVDEDAAEDEDPGLIDDLLDQMGLSDSFVDEDNDDTDTATYKVWVGDTQVTETNKNDILGDGTASFDPTTDTLTLNNADINRFSTTANGANSDGYNIFATQTLIIKGSASLTSGKGGICVFDFSGKATLTIDADLDIDTETTGIMAFGPDLYINGGNINIQTAAKSIGIMGYNRNIIIKNGNINITGQPMLGILGVMNLEISGAVIDVCGSQAAVAMDYNDSIINLTLPTWVIEPAGAQVGNVVLPNSKGRLIATAGIANADGTNATRVKIGSKPGIKTNTVTFDMQEHGSAICPVKVESGYPVSAPFVPYVKGYIVKGWYKEAECTTEYEFNTPVTEDITLYAKWGESKVEPVEGSGSAVDPVPVIEPGTTKDLYLVKGQKFDIGDGWSVNKEGSKVISISKKGALKAKKDGEAVISAQNGDDIISVNVHVAAPKIINKSLKLEIRSAENIAYGDINLNFIGKENYNIFWHSADPDVATVDQNGKVTAVSKGKTKVTAYVNGNAYTCTVSVKEIAAAGKRTLHIAKGSSKSLSIKGVKKPEWTASPEGIVSFKGKKKVIGDTAGFTTLTTTAGENTYIVETYVEDLTLYDTYGWLKGDKNKYTLSIKTEETTRIRPDSSVHQDVVFRSNKNKIAFIDENGNIYARSKGKCKLTAKIDNKTITINVEVQ